MPRLEKRKMDVLYLVGDDGVDYGHYCSEDGFHLSPEAEGMLPSDHDLQKIMFEHLSEGRDDCGIEF